MTVYVDVLILLNFYIDYLIIRLCIYVLKIKVKSGRVILASFFASLMSLAIFLPESTVIQIATKVLTAFIIALILNGRKRLLKIGSMLLLTAFVFNGVFAILSDTVFKNSIISVNGCTYLDISISVFAIASLCIYVVLKLVSRLFFVKNESDFKIRIAIGANEIIFDGMSDSGNKLKDYLTGKPIVVCPDSEIFSNAKTIRLLPFNTINSEGIIRIINPDRVEVIYNNGTTICPDVLIGVMKENQNIAIVNPCVLV